MIIQDAPWETLDYSTVSWRTYLIAQADSLRCILVSYLQDDFYYTFSSHGPP